MDGEWSWSEKIITLKCRHLSAIYGFEYVRSWTYHFYCRYQYRESILTCVAFFLRFVTSFYSTLRTQQFMWEMNILIKLKITVHFHCVWAMGILTTANIHFNRSIVPFKKDEYKKSTKVRMSFRHVSVTSTSIFTNLDVIAWNKFNFNYLSIIICVWECTMPHSFHGVVAANQTPFFKCSQNTCFDTFVYEAP